MNRNKKRNTTHHKGFTLIELLVVIVIIGLLAGIGIASFSGSLQRGRDAVRLSTVKEVKDAVERYWVETGNYPGTTASYGEGPASCGGWDSSREDADGDGIAWVDPLVVGGYLESAPRDPSLDTTPTTGCGNYDYYRYTAGDYGCDASRGDYYVLGIRNLEATTGAHPDSQGWYCPGIVGVVAERQWQDEFEWVVAKFQR